MKEVLAGDNILFTDFAEQWFMGKQAVLSTNTLDKYRYLYNKHIRPAFSDLKITEVTVDKLQAFTNAKMRTLSVATVKEMVSAILSQVFKKALGMQLIKMNPIQFIEKPKQDKRSHKRALTEDEVRALYRVSKPHKLGFSIPLLLLTGMRRGEMLGLTWNDIDFDNREIHVSKAFVSTRSKGDILKGTKTAGSDRYISIPDSLVQMLKDYRKTQPQGSVYVISQSKADAMVNPNNFSRLFRSWCAKAGIKDVSVHSTRHTYCTVNLECRIDTFTIMQQVGHTTSRMLMQVYGHKRTNELQQRGADKIGSYMDTLLGA